MTKMKNQETKKSLAYTESKSLRESTLDSVDYDFLDKLKVVPYLTDDMVLSTHQIAQYYDVGLEAIKTIIKRNRAEFEEDGMIILKGQELKEFKEKLTQVQSEPDLIRIPSITLLTKRSLLRCGMILTNSEMATKVRNYLLNVEEITEVDRKSWAIQREVSIIERKRFSTALNKYLPDSEHKRFAYPNYTNMIYRILFGCDAKTLREQKNVKDNDALRDSFTVDELKLVEEAETIVSGLIAIDFTYEQIKEALSNKYIKKIA